MLSRVCYSSIVISDHSHDTPQAALDVDMLKREGFTHIVNTCEGTDFYHCDTGPDFYAEAGISYHGFAADDSTVCLPLSPPTHPLKRPSTDPRTFSAHLPTFEPTPHPHPPTRTTHPPSLDLVGFVIALAERGMRP